MLLIAAGGCIRPTAPTAADRVQTAASWTATAQLTTEAWLAGTVPDQYASHSLALAERRLIHTPRPDSVAALPHATASLVDSLISHAARETLVLAQAVEHDDHDAAQSPLAALRAARQQLTRLQDSLATHPPR